MKRSVYLSSLLALCCTLFAITARAQAPVVTTHPVSDTICTADTAWFSTVVTGATPLTFQWEFSTDGGTTWDTTTDGTTYLGTFNDTLRVIGTMPMNGTKYRMIAFNTVPGSDTSDVVTLSVEAPAAAITGPSIVCKGSNITLANAVAGGTWSSLHPTIATIGSGTGIVTGVDFGMDTIVYTVLNTCGTTTDSATVRVDTNMVAYPITGPNAVCVGNTITLANLNTIGAKTWSTGITGRSSVSATGVVTGLAAGLDTVTYTINNACNSQTVTKTVMIETLPAAGTITGANTICAGSWITLTASAAPAGFWISGNPAAAVVSSAGNVTGIAAGSSVISYYQSNSCGASFATHIVTVDIPASTATIIGNDSVGVDSTIVLASLVPGGSWSTADASIATVGSSTGWVTGEATGVTDIIYTVTNTCGTTSASIAMNVGPLPSAGTLSGPDTVCVGATITLTSSVTGGTWSSRHDTLATVSGAGVVTGIEAGRDTIDYYVTNAFGRGRVTKQVYVNEPPFVYVTGPSTVSLGGSYVEYGFPAGGVFTSSNPGMGLITAQSSTVDSSKLKATGFFVVVDTGMTIFTYTKSNTCGARSAKDTVHLPGASDVKSIGKGAAQINIFPNPSQGALSINLTSAVNEEVVFTLTNVTGQAVQEFKVQANTPTNIYVDQPAGVYMLNAVTKDGNRHSARISITR